MSKKKDLGLQDVMAEEGSRGRRHPVKAVNLERQRRIRKAIEMTKKRISKKEFIKRFTDLAIRHLAKLSPEEQEARLQAFETRVATICRDTRPTPSRIPETRAIRLATRGREDH